jgi:hypothetical protein
VTLALDWDRATLHPLDERTQRLDVPLPEHIDEATRTSLASALVSLEVVGGPIEVAKLSRSHIRMEISLGADVQDIRRRVQELVDGGVSPTG